MEFAELLTIVGNLPVFETGLLLSGPVSPPDVRRQLSRWMRSGQIIQLRRGLYALAPPYQKAKPHPFLVANALIPGSYVSLQAALAFYGLIPEITPVTTSVGVTHPRRWDTPLGSFAFRHIQPAWLHGYERLDVGNDQHAFVAAPEKALLDLVYLEPGGDQYGFLEGLRLQGLERLDLDRLAALADKSDRPKLQRAVVAIKALVQAEQTEYDTL